MIDNAPDASAAKIRQAARSGWRGVVTATSVTVLFALVAVAGCVEQAVPAETVESLRQQSPTLQNKSRLRIGVRDTVPFLSFKDPQTGTRQGFEIEIAKALASELGFTEDRIDWVTVSTVPSRLEVLQANRADMVVASLSMTKEREEFVDFAGPYQLVPQAVLVRKDRTKQIATITDLRSPDVRVCTGTGSTSEKALKDKGIEPEPVDSNTQCIEGMRTQEYDAYSTDLPILASFIAAEPDVFEILELAIADNSERIGVAVPNGDWAMRDLIAYFLNRWLLGPQPSPWMRAYDRTIGPHLDPKHRSQPLVDNPPQLADYDSKVLPR